MDPRHKAALFRAMIPYRAAVGRPWGAPAVTTDAGELNEVLAGMGAQLRARQRAGATARACAAILEELGR